MAHIALAAVKTSGQLLGVITQNIDGHHQVAASKNIPNVHNRVHRNYCTRCNPFFSLGACK